MPPTWGHRLDSSPWTYSWRENTTTAAPQLCGDHQAHGRAGPVGRMAPPTPALSLVFLIVRVCLALGS